MNDRDSPPPIQMFEIPRPRDYDTALNLPKSPDLNCEPSLTNDTLTSNRLSGLATSDPAPPYFIVVGQPSELSETNPVVQPSQANPVVRQPTHSIRHVNPPSELATSDPDPPTHMYVDGRTSEFSLANQRPTSPVNVQAPTRPSSPSSLVECAMFCSSVSFCAIFPVICARKYRYQQHLFLFT